ncbi:MAG: regulatory iron-sulfur-containing complex subunit RicT [bacterium]
MTDVISVKFKNKGKVYYFSPNGLTVKKGDFVIVETAKGVEYAECVAGNHAVDDRQVRAPLRPVTRLATPSDMRRAEENRKAEKRAFEVCRTKIKERGMDMKLVDVEYNFEGNKILFFFTSEGRVDFRELVKDLASTFHTRIELRQIGVRDEARMLGGLGICGRNYCCAQFLDDFQPVSIKMAKNQGFSLNPTKISGACGRLMCCLKYEEAAYEELVKLVPKVDSFVETPVGKGTVVDVNLLKSTVRVRLEDVTELPVRTFSTEELTVLGGKAKRAEYLQLKAEGKLPPEEQTAGNRFRKNAPEPKRAQEDRPHPPEETRPQEQPQKKRGDKPYRQSRPKPQEQPPREAKEQPERRRPPVQEKKPQPAPEKKQQPRRETRPHERAPESVRQEAAAPAANNSSNNNNRRRFFRRHSGGYKGGGKPTGEGKENA